LHEESELPRRVLSSTSKTNGFQARGSWTNFKLALLNGPAKYFPALNFDYVLPGPDRRMSEEMLTSIYVSVRTHIRDLVTEVTQLTSTASDEIDNYELSGLTTLSHELSQIFEHATFQRKIESLTDALHSFLTELNKHRPLGRASPLLRAAIQYSSWELAEHLSYWLGEKQTSKAQHMNRPGQNGTNPQKVLDSYLDIAMTLALLEERIEGKQSPSEGIVLVRERSEHRKQAP
jgi:hypothetical protein